MKKLFAALAILAFSQNSWGAVSEADQALQAFRNLLTNPGAELGKTAWAVSTGSFAASTSSPLIGNASFTWDAGATSETFTSTAVTVPEGWKGRNGVVSCSFLCASGTCTHTLTAYDGSNNLASPATITSSTTVATRTSVNFIYPSSGSVSLRVTSAANEPSVKIDSCVLALADGFNMGLVSQAQLVGSAYFATTASCTFTRTNTALGAMADTDCPGPTVETNPGPGTIQTTDANAPIVTVNSLPPGNYAVHFIGASTSGSGNPYAALAINDGTTTAGQTAANKSSSASAPFHVVGVFSYTTSGNRSFELYASSASSSVDIDLTASNQRLYFYIERFPTSSETAYRPEMINWKVDANISGANASLGTVDVSTFTGIEDGSLTLTNNSGAGNLTAAIPCSSTNASSGTTCSAGNESIGVSFTLPVAGDVMACVSFTAWIKTAASGADEQTFEIVETPNSAQTISQEGKTRIENRLGAASSDLAGALRVCGNFTFTSAGQKTLRLFYEQDATATLTSSQILADASAANGQRDIHWEVYPINQYVPAPILVGGLTQANTSGSESHNRAVVKWSAGTPSIYAQNGTWITSGSLTDNGAGDVTLPFVSGTFTSEPSCVCTGINNTGTANSTQERNCRIVLVNGTTSVRVLVTDGSFAGVDSADGAAVFCQGPR